MYVVAESVVVVEFRCLVSVPEVVMVVDQVVELVQRSIVDPSVTVHQKGCMVGDPSMTVHQQGRQVVLESMDSRW